MASAIVNLPQKMTLDQLMYFIRELDSYVMHRDITLRFDRNTFLAPFSMLLIAAKLKQLKNTNPDIHIHVRNHEEQEYAAHMGFFRMFGIEFGRDVGEAWGNENYQPIRCLTRQSFYERPEDKYEEIQDLIQRHADSVALVISRDREHKDLFDVLSYSIREIIRNVFEHSQSDELYYCAQYWPKINKAEIAIVDFGIGIRRSLVQNPNFAFLKRDKDAVEYCLLPSVSGKTHLSQPRSGWHNSGYGLYMTSRLSRNGGNFVIASGSSAIHLTRRTKNNLQCAFSGTAIRMNIDINEIGNVEERLASFRKEGFEFAKTIQGSGNRPPSAMSLLLRRDFKV